MLIKKYIVNDITAGMAQIKMELGSDIIIVSQRKVRKEGLRGYFLPKEIEITVAYEKEMTRNNLYEKAIVDFTKSPHNNKEIINRVDYSKSEYEDPSANNKIIKEVSDMKEILNRLINKSNDSSRSSKEEFHHYIKFLQEHDIPEELIVKISQLFTVESLDRNKIDIDKLNSMVTQCIDFELCDNDELNDGIFAFVGPTGVGKTTTIAKLAGKYALEYKKKVGLITVDTYRIGAIEQLKTYAEIMGIPFEVVFNIKDMEHAINAMKDCDLIFLDTTGRSSKNLMQLQELKAYVKKAKPNKVFLVLSATTKDKDINAIIDGYRVMDYENIIVTKLDETISYGSLLSIIKNSKVPLSYVTTGQGVPQDIMKIKTDQLIQLVLGETTIC